MIITTMLERPTFVQCNLLDAGDILKTHKHARGSVALLAFGEVLVGEDGNPDDAWDHYEGPALIPVPAGKCLAFIALTDVIVNCVHALFPDEDKPPVEV